MTTTPQLQYAAMLARWRAYRATVGYPPMTNARPQLAPLLRAEDVAEALGVTADFVYALARRDEIPHVRIGRTVRFRADVIDEWLQANVRGTMPEAS